MLFRKKERLKKEFDEKVLVQLTRFKDHWQREKRYLENSFEPSEEAICHTKIAEAKYIFLLREAKHRNISLL